MALRNFEPDSSGADFSGITKMAKQLTNILTEAGTNEVEVLVFQLDGGRYGVNVAKVREIIATAPLTKLPESHPAVRGVLKLRDHVVPLVDLRTFFQMPPSENEANSRVIVMEFNSERLGFLVDHVERIHRLSWKAMSEVPWSGGDGDTAITSVVHINDQMVLMLDFERVAFRIAGIENLQCADPQTSNYDRSKITILLADDSATMRRMLSTSLEQAKFGRIIICNDGEAAWEKLNEMLQAGSLPDAIVTDIEMPKMDGLYFTKLIKEEPRLKALPVIVFSSLVSDDNLKKCKAVGADRQLTKPELPGLVHVLDELLAEVAAV